MLESVRQNSRSAIIYILFGILIAAFVVNRGAQVRQQLVNRAAFGSGTTTAGASTRNSTTCGVPLSGAACRSCGPTRAPSASTSSAVHGPGSSHTSDDTAERDHGSSIASPGKQAHGTG